jgi:hypothetical protein
MEICLQLKCNTQHQTSWNPRAAGKGAKAGYPFVQIRQKPANDRTGSECFSEYCIPLASGLPRERGSRVKAPTESRPSSQAEQSSKKLSCPDPVEQPFGWWVWDRLVDLKPGSQSDPQAIRRSISSQPRMKTARRLGVELSEGGAASFTKRRGKDRSLETVPLGPYRKTPTDVRPIWSFLMNRAFCCFRTLHGPGPRNGSPPFFASFTNRIVFRPSMLWPYRQNGNAWPCIFNFELVISQGWISTLSSNICFPIFEVPLSCYGTEASFPGGKRKTNISSNIPASRRSISVLMRRNSIRPNMFGTRWTICSPIVLSRTWHSSRGSSEIQPAESANPTSSFGHASTLLICLAQDSSFHCLANMNNKSKYAAIV